MRFSFFFFSSRSVQNVKCVRIEYWVEKAETGIHFNGDVLHTDNQLRRARCWFPCLDDSLQSCWYLSGLIANLNILTTSYSFAHLKLFCIFAQL